MKSLPQHPASEPSDTGISLKSTSLYHSRCGFSLVEVVIALGIASFALTAILGLLSVGFQSTKATIETSTRSDITQSVMAEAQLTPFASLATTFNNQTRYYDNSGKRITQPGSAVFVVKSAISNAPSVINGDNNADAKRLVITIHSVTAPNDTKTFSRLLVRSEESQ